MAKFGASSYDVGVFQAIRDSTLPRFTSPLNTTMETQWYNTFHFFATCVPGSLKVLRDFLRLAARELAS